MIESRFYEFEDMLVKKVHFFGIGQLNGNEHTSIIIIQSDSEVFLSKLRLLISFKYDGSISLQLFDDIHKDFILWLRKSFDKFISINISLSRKLMSDKMSQF